MENIFITQVVPKNIIGELNVSQAANNFSYSLIEANCFDSAVSLIPINIIEKINFSESNIKKVQCRFFPHKSIFRVFNMAVENIFLSLKVREYKHIWFYNITVHTLLAFLVIKYIFRKKVFVIVADYGPSQKRFSIQPWIKKEIQASSGIISLSARSEFKHKNSIVIPGIRVLSSINSIFYPLSKKGKRKFLFSGVLGEVTGLPMALEIFKDLKDIDLFVSGRENSTIIDDYRDCSNIHFLGFLSFKEYLELLKKMDICLNFRNPELTENNNNFPSKILEYFSFYKPVISTISYPELTGFNYFKIEYEKELLKLKINEINKMDEESLLKYCNHSDLLVEKFSENAWKKAIRNIQNKV